MDGSKEVADWWYSVHQQCEREAQLSSQTQQTMGMHCPIITCFVPIGCFESPLISPSDSVNSALLVFHSTSISPSLPPILSPCFSGLLCVPASLSVSSEAPSLQHFSLFVALLSPSFPLFLPVCMSPAGRLCGAVWSRGS